MVECWNFTLMAQRALTKSFSLSLFQRETMDCPSFVKRDKGRFYSPHPRHFPLHNLNSQCYHHRAINHLSSFSLPLQITPLPLNLSLDGRGIKVRVKSLRKDKRKRSRHIMPRQKRHRGGQPRNQNARRHGFYSPYMSQPEVQQLEQIIETEGIAKMVAVYRVKLNSALNHAPGNARLVREAAALLAKWYCSRYELNGEDKTFVKKFIRDALKTQVNAGTNLAEIINPAPKAPNESKLINIR
jgi:hypothetical protein